MTTKDMNGAAAKLRSAQEDFFNGRPASARQSFQEARTLFEQAKDSAAVANVLSELAVLEGSLGRADQARRLLDEAVRLSEGCSDRRSRSAHERRIGDIEASIGNCDSARERYKTALEICRELSDEQGEALSWLGIGALASAMSNYNEARDGFDRANSLHGSEADPAHSALLSRHTGDLERRVGRMPEAEAAYGDARVHYSHMSIEARGYWHFGVAELARMRSDPNASSEFRKALQLFETCEHRYGQGAVHTALGDIARQSGDPTIAADEFRTAIEHLKAVNGRLGLANAHRGLALVERNAGRYTEANRAFNNARVYYRSTRHAVGEAHALRGIGEIDYLQGSFAEARESLLQALEIYKAYGQPQGEANAQVSLGDVEKEIGNLVAARSAYQRAFNLYRQLEEPLGTTNAIRSIAHIDYLEGRPRDARRRYTAALSKYKSLATPLGVANCHLGLAEVELLEKRYPEALTECEHALVISKKIDQKLVCADSMLLMGRTQHAMEHHGDAVTSFENAARLFDLLEHQKERLEASELADSVRAEIGAAKNRALPTSSTASLPKTSDSVPAEGKRLVILVHGIRTEADWFRVVKPVLESAGFVVATVNFERLGTLAFWLPIPLFRNAAVKKVWRDIRSARARYQEHKVSYIAHSFGSYVIARLLREESDMRAQRVIFCGSIVPARFELDEVITRVESQSVLNEVGTHDVWPAMAEAVTWGYGPVGTSGFRRPFADDRWHARFGHGTYLNGEFCRTYWVPYLRDGTIVPTIDQDTHSPGWYKWLHWIKRLYAAAAVGLAVALYFAMK